MSLHAPSSIDFVFVTPTGNRLLWRRAALIDKFSDVVLMPIFGHRLIRVRTDADRVLALSLHVSSKRVRCHSAFHVQLYTSVHLVHRISQVNRTVADLKVSDWALRRLNFVLL